MNSIQHFERAVQADLTGTASTEQTDMLDDDLQLWRDKLVEMARSIDADLARGKSDRSYRTVSEFQSVRADMIKRKTVIQDRLADVKAMLTENSSKSHDTLITCQKEILAELREIKGLLKPSLGKML